MTIGNKIDSNFTGLRFAVEQSAGVLPTVPVWLVAEPNKYDKFGAKIKTVARNPINDGRQRKKGVVTDLDAEAGYEMDITEDNSQVLMQSFLFAQARKNAELFSPGVTAAGATYNPASGGAAYYANNLLFAKLFTRSGNNGLKKVSGTPTGTAVGVTTTLLDEGGSAGIISRVGHELAAGIGTIDVSGTLPKLVQSGVVAGTQVGTTTGNFVNGDTVTLGTKVYTFQTVLTNVDGNVLIAGTAQLSLANLANAINRNGVGVAGTDFALATTANTQVTAVSSVSTITLTSIVWGTPANSIATTDTGANFSFGAATLTGGTGRSFFDLGLIVGSWVCLGDDLAGTSFVNPQNNGLKRIRVIDNVSFTFDKSTLAMVTDSGATKTIRILFGRVIKNEIGTNIVRQTVQFERTLGIPDDAFPTSPQAEYITGCVADTLDVQVKQADKITCKLNFMARDQELKTVAQGLKAGTRPVAVESDAFNSSSHVVRMSLAAIDPLTATPVDLFAFLLDLGITIKNNVKANKAVKFLGSFDNSAGQFTVDAKMTAYFQTVAAITAVRNNSDVTLDLTLAQGNKGLTFDLPLVALATDGADVKQDEAIMLPVTSAAATGSKLDVNLNHTLLTQFWDYIPTLAA